MRLFTSLLTISALTLTSSLLAADEVRKAPLNVSIEVPNPTWSANIQKAYTKAGKLLVVCNLNQKPGAGIMVISKANDSIQLPASLSKLPKQILVTGKTWNWSNGGYTAVTGKELQKILEGAKLVYPTKKAEDKKKQTDADFIGLTVKEVQTLAKQRKLVVRVVNVDGESYIVTADYSTARVNLTIIKGKITSTTRG